ncbi:MAG: hypothetical protein P1U56_01940 [Saprospiraceae bacterium]|nr:hypothetical protein [Saprospiraceae bacterium]
MTYSISHIELLLDIEPRLPELDCDLEHLDEYSLQEIVDCM